MVAYAWRKTFTLAPNHLPVDQRHKVAGGPLYLSLRHQSKQYRKRYGKNDYRGIPNHVEIADRPSVVDSRSRIGDWEADCAIGKTHKSLFAPLAERKISVSLALPTKHKTTQKTNAAILGLLERITICDDANL